LFLFLYFIDELEKIVLRETKFVAAELSAAAVTAPIDSAGGDLVLVPGDKLLSL